MFLVFCVIILAYFFIFLSTNVVHTEEQATPWPFSSIRYVHAHEILAVSELLYADWVVKPLNNPTKNTSNASASYQVSQPLSQPI